MRFVLAAAATLLAFAPPTRAEAEIMWEGQLVLRGLSPACPNDFLADFQARFKPELPGNDPGSHLMLFSETFTLGLWLNSGNISSSFQLVDTVDVFENVHSIAPSVYLRFLHVSQPFAAAANFIDVIGQIKGWEGEVNCVATFHMALTQRP
jgi:hypothetical protein